MAASDPVFEELSIAVARLNDARLSPDNRTVSVSSGSAELQATATPGTDGRFDITLTVGADGIRQAGVALLLYGISAADRVVVLEGAGHVVVPGVTAATWQFDVLGAPEPGGIPLPPINREGSDVVPERYVVETPDGLRYTVVIRGTGGRYRLTVTSRAGQHGIVRLRYRSGGGETAVMFIPLFPSPLGPPTATVMLADISPADAWETTGVFLPGELAGTYSEIRKSVEAAADNGTRRAWQAIADQTPPTAGRAIRGEPPKPGDEPALPVETPSEPDEEPADDAFPSRPGPAGAARRPRPDPPPSTKPSTKERRSASRRQLAADLPSRAAVGERVNLIVRVVGDRSTDHTAVAPMRAMDIPPGGARVLIAVEVPRGLKPLDGLERSLVVFADRDSDPVMLPFEVYLAGRLIIRVTAWASGNNFAGELELELSAETDAPAIPRRTATTELAGLGPVPGRGVLQITRPFGHYQFQLRAESLIPYEPIMVEGLGSGGDEAIERDIMLLREMATSASPYSGAAAREALKEIGVNLWNRAVPDAVKAQFWELLPHITSLSIVSRDDVIPWELLYPLSIGHDEGFLVERLQLTRHVIGRWLTGVITASPARFTISRPPPPLALEEIQHINRLLDSGEGPIYNRFVELKSWIESGDAGLIHFAAHNQFGADADGAWLKMADGVFRPRMLATAAATQSLESRHPLVFINACRSAGAHYEYGHPMSWASEFMKAGAGAFIGTLWAVPDHRARSFAEAFYEAAITRAQPLGQAVSIARSAIKNDHDPSWLSYTVYGDPGAKLASSLA